MKVEPRLGKGMEIAGRRRERKRSVRISMIKVHDIEIHYYTQWIFANKIIMRFLSFCQPITITRSIKFFFAKEKQKQWAIRYVRKEHVKGPLLDSDSLWRGGADFTNCSQDNGSCCLGCSGFAATETTHGCSLWLKPLSSSTTRSPFWYRHLFLKTLQ